MYKDLYDSDPIPKFCSRCGSILVKTFLEDGFNPYTGEKAYKNYWACPDSVKNLSHTWHDVWEIHEKESEPLIRMAYI